MAIQVGYDMSKRAAQQAFAKAGLKPEDVQVVELHGKRRREYVLGRKNKILSHFFFFERLIRNHVNLQSTFLISI